MNCLKPICFCLLLVICVKNTIAQDIYVDKKGNDTYNGTKDKPVATLEAARDLIRKFKSFNNLPDSGITVWINEGVYDLKSSLVLNEKDAGNEKQRIVWTAKKGANVTLTGGVTIPSNKFKPVNDAATLKRLSKEAAKHLWSVNLTELGITNFGKHQQIGHSLPVVPAPLELFFNDAPMQLAKYPNNGFIKVGKVLDKGSVPRVGDKSGRGASFLYDDARISTWDNKNDIWLNGTFNYGYADDNILIDSIDVLNKRIKLASPHLYGVASGRDFQQYTANNIFEEIDSPGEWYLNRTTGILYFWPPSDIQKANITVSILEEPIVCLEGVSFVTIKGITIQAGRGIGIYMERANNNLIAGCTIKNIGTSGIFMGQGAEKYAANMSVDDYDGKPISRQVGSLQNHLYSYTTWDRLSGHDNKVLSCDIYNTGSGGVYLSGGSKLNLINGNNVVENCKIHDFNRRNHFTWSGINVDGCGNKVTHCEIYNSDFQGIYVHGNEHVFEYNNIHDVTLNSDDTSPWYIGRDPSDRGNIVRYNYFHDCGNPNRMNMGIYCDDSSTDVYVFGNVFSNMKTTHGVLFSNNGWDLVMKNNIVVNPISYTAEISAAFYTWAAPQAKEFYGPNGLLQKRLIKSVNFKSPPYSIKYPKLLSYLDPIVEGKEWEGMRTRGNLLAKNVIVGGPANPISLLGGQYATMQNEQNFVTKEDPGFVDMKQENFLLKPDSKVFTIIPGFEPIPFNKMGLYKDSYRN